MDRDVYIRRLNAAEPNEFAAMLMNPTPEEERVLRLYFGDERFQRMHEMALVAVTRGAQPTDNVVVIHGIMGGELTAASTDAQHNETKIWLNYFRLFLGDFGLLRLNEIGNAETEQGVVVSATGMIKKYYGELLLSLKQQFNVCQFWFDWRKDLRTAAVQLAAKAAQTFGANRPFHIVAHSMGGLVARWYIHENEQTWKKGEHRLIMLGTPNFGSFAVPQIVTGLEGIVRKIALIDTHKDAGQVAAIANTFPGSYQMLPSPLRMPSMAPLYDAATWATFAANVPKAHLDSAKAFHTTLNDLFDDSMVYIAGYGQDTLNDVDIERLDEADAYEHTKAGDGRVPHKLGFPDGFSPVYYVRESHGSLPTNVTVHAAVSALLNGHKPALPTSLPADRGVAAEPPEGALLARDIAELEVIRMQTYAGRGTSRSAEQVDRQSARAEEILVRGWLDPEEEAAEAGARGASREL